MSRHARILTIPSIALVAVVAFGLALLLPTPAHAACHIAGFVESEVAASESTGVVSLVVELQGRAGSCAGTVDIATVDGTAVADEDYETVTQTLTFEENDDRVETVDVPILADDEADGGETFTVELSNPTGDISGTGGPATVTITDDGGDAQDADDEPTEPATTTDDTAADAQDDVVADDPEETEDDGLNLGILIAVIAAIAIGIGAFALLRGRA